ncbi:MAG: universal stress protein [Thermodesulfobacteriota bacterium]
MEGKKILVLMDSESADFSALHHGLALAGRIGGQVIILRIESSDGKPGLAGWAVDAVYELVNRAREAGIGVSCNTLKGRSEEALLGFVREQGIDLLVVGDVERHWESDLLQLKLGGRTQIIGVREKGTAGEHATRRRRG